MHIISVNLGTSRSGSVANVQLPVARLHHVRRNTIQVNSSGELNHRISTNEDYGKKCHYTNCQYAYIYICVTIYVHKLNTF